MEGEEILNQVIRDIASKAAVYTEEWRFDEENPDIGTALALVLAQMLAGTKERFERLPNKLRYSFYSEIGASVLPAVPSSGYVRFALVNDEVAGTNVPAGSVVLASLPGEERSLTFETKQALFVSPAEICSIFFTWDLQDIITKQYDREAVPEYITLFDGRGMNLQEHVIYFSHSGAIGGSGAVFLQAGFFLTDGRSINSDLISWLTDPNFIEISYSAEEGFIPFTDCTERGGRILLYKSAEQPAFAQTEIGTAMGCFIRLRLKHTEKWKEFEFASLRLSAKSLALKPDILLAAGLPCMEEAFLPFGEEPAVFTEFMAGSEILCKKGADITIHFSIGFRRTPYGEPEQEEIEWDWVMKRPEKKKEVIYETSVDTILWEYYNGKGWAALPGGERYTDIFNSRQPEEPYRTMEFRCPEDIEPVLAGAAETYFIRARVIKIKNPYKRKGYYIAPEVSNFTLEYAYEPDSLLVREIWAVNNRTLERYEGTGPVFRQTGCPCRAMYLRFQRPPLGSPLRFLFTVAKDQKKAAVLDWQYYSKKGWRGMELSDGTRSFTRSGLLTWNGTEDISEKSMFEEQGYWIRILDKTGAFSETQTGQTDMEETVSFPVLTGIYANVTEAVQFREKETEYFSVETNEEQVSFKLLHEDIIESEVWVEEKERESSADWVLWEKQESFAASSSADRHYSIDPVSGTLRFGDGKHGKIPPHGTENIKILYRSGGGRKGNIEAGMIGRMAEAAGFVNRVSNPLSFAGGSDRETAERAAERKAAALRHQNRAVTAGDFEKLVFDSCQEAAEVRCFTGIDSRGNRQAGFVTLVVLLEDAIKRKNLFPVVREQIFRFLESRADSALLNSDRFCIREPEFALVNVNVELGVREFEGVQPAREAAENAIAQLFRLPDRGRRANFQIGSFPSTDQIRNVIFQTTGIDRIRQLYLRPSEEAGQDIFAQRPNTTQRSPFIQPVNGKHEIIVRVY